MVPFCDFTLSARKPLDPAYPKELKTLGDHLRKRRVDLGLHQRDVGQRLGIDVQSVRNWEGHRSNPKTYLIPRIYDFLGYAPLEPTGSLAEMLRTYRRAAGLSKKRLAKLARIDETTLGLWERGEARRPMPATVRRLRRFFKRLGMPMPEIPRAVSRVRPSMPFRPIHEARRRCLRELGDAPIGWE